VRNLKQVVVTKHDGTLERFSLTKLTNCLATVMRRRAYDPRLADPLSKAVAMHLQEWRDLAPPSTNYLYRCVRSVLQQTGLSDVADELATHRQQRRWRRVRIRVVDPQHAAPEGELWCKARLVETLQNRHGLRYPVARFLASRIENQVFALDYRVVSGAFLRELMRSEVLAWGLADEPALCEPAAAAGPLGEGGQTAA
jgi:hypothetical protein